MPEQPPSVLDLERNDLDGAIAIVRWYKAHGRELSPDLFQTLAMLQDDADAFLSHPEVTS